MVTSTLAIFSLLAIYSCTIEGKTSNFYLCNSTCLLTWTRHPDGGSELCECVSPLAGEHHYSGACTGSQLSGGPHVKLNLQFCMTFDEENNVTFVGECPYNNLAFYQMDDGISLPRNALELNKYMCNFSHPTRHHHFCGQQRRYGFLCSMCEDGLGPSVMSYTHQCVECMWYGWLLYFTLSFAPATILCFVVIVFRINVLSPPFNAIILYCQIILSYVNTMPCRFLYYVNDHNVSTVVLYVLTFYGFFNMDFFVYIVPPFCIRNTMSTLTAIALDYTVALYPLVLSAVIYFLIEIHDSGCRVFLWLWRPFHACLVRFRKRWDIKGSVINAFATLYIMSYTKIISTSVGLMQTTDIQNSCGNFARRSKLYYNSSCSLLESCHLPYAFIMTTIAIVFVFIPSIFLFLHPFRLCRKFQCSTRCSESKPAVLSRELTKLFQHSFKDGIEGGIECRWFAGMYLFIRVVIATSVDWKTTHYIQVIASVFILMVVAIFQPHTHTFFNYVDSFLFGGLAVTFMLLPAGDNQHIAQVIIFFIPLTLLVVLVCWKFVHKCWRRRKECVNLIHYLQKCVGTGAPAEGNGEDERLMGNSPPVLYSVVDLTD